MIARWTLEACMVAAVELKRLEEIGSVKLVSPGKEGWLKRFLISEMMREARVVGADRTDSAAWPSLRNFSMADG